MQTRLILLLLFILPFTSIRAQKSISDSVIFTNLIYGNYAMQIPGGDMADRFGMNSQIGPGFLFKSAHNWLLGVEGNFLFGSQVNHQENILKNIETADGNIIDMEGIYADYRFNERGFSGFIKCGKIIPAFGPNRNSGIMVTLGGGYLQHKIFIEHRDKTAPQITGDYLKGYDELKRGFASNLFLGYLYLGNSQKANFFAGIDFTWAFTTYVRPYSFAGMKYNSGAFTDTFTGFKVGWVIPVYRRAPKDFYFY